LFFDKEDAKTSFNLKNILGKCKRKDLCKKTVKTAFAHYSNKSISYLCSLKNLLNPKISGSFFASFERLVGHVSDC